jgi:hypothetical protein
MEWSKLILECLSPMLNEALFILNGWSIFCILWPQNHKILHKSSDCLVPIHFLNLGPIQLAKAWNNHVSKYLKYKRVRRRKEKCWHRYFIMVIGSFTKQKSMYGRTEKY